MWNHTVTLQNHDTSIKQTLCWHVWVPVSKTRAVSVSKQPDLKTFITLWPQPRFLWWAVDFFLEKPQTTLCLKSSQSRSYHFRPIRTEKQTTRSIKRFTEVNLITTHYPFSGNLETAEKNCNCKKSDSKHPANRFHNHKKELWHGPGMWTLSSHTACLFLLNQMIRSNENSQNSTKLETPIIHKFFTRPAPCVCKI